MTITANNITEVIIGLIALAGEIPKDVGLSGISNRTMQNHISKGKKEMLIKVDREHNRIRLRAPKGLEYLRDFSEDLYLHYMMISNGHRFQRSKKAVENLRCHSEATLCMIRNGYAIDNIRLVHSSNHFGGNPETLPELVVIRAENGEPEFRVDRFSVCGEIRPVSEAARCTGRGERRYYSSKYLKHGYPVTHRINLSGISGVMLCSGNMYSLYYFPDGSISVSPASEAVMNRRLMEIYEAAFGKEAAIERGKIMPKGSAILMGRNMEPLPGKTAALERAFDEYKIINNNKQGDAVINILSCENWRERLNDALYINNKPAWEFLSCEYNHIREIRRIKSPVSIIIFSWQQDILKRALKKCDVEIYVLTAEQERILQDVMT